MRAPRRPSRRPPDVTENYRLVDLFCGAGGMTLGFSPRLDQPFISVWANDFNEPAAATYNKNFGPHCTWGDIRTILDREPIPIADVVIGGPPCQGFSLLNKQRTGDPRKELWQPYFDVVERSGASVFVMENVPQLLDAPEFKRITRRARDLGFMLWSGKLIAADYGVPQVRQRAFLVGCNFTDPAAFFPPLKTHYNPRQPYNLGDLRYVASPEPWRTVADAIKDLQPPEGTELRNEPPPLDLHFGRTPTLLSLRRYKTISKQGMNRFDLQRLAPHLTPACWIRKKTGGTDLFGRLWWNRPAFTIRTEFFKPEKGRYLHPVQHRPITHREAARFQSFPDDFQFCGSKIEIAKQIGNAVPPLLAARIAECVRALLAVRPELEQDNLAATIATA